MHICVFGSSSSKTSESICTEASKLGGLIASKNLVCVNGGGKFGVMGAVNAGCSEAGGDIVGVIHREFVVDGQEDPRIKRWVIVEGRDLGRRKEVLFDHSDAFIVMPGGLGTLDELFDGVGSKSLSMKSLSHKPFVLVNIDGFYDGTLQQLARCQDESLLYGQWSNFLGVVDNVEDALAYVVDKLATVDKTLLHNPEFEYAESVRVNNEILINDSTSGSRMVVRDVSTTSTTTSEPSKCPFHRYGEVMTAFVLGAAVSTAVAVAMLRQK